MRILRISVIALLCIISEQNTQTEHYAKIKYTYNFSVCFNTLAVFSYKDLIISVDFRIKEEEFDNRQKTEVFVNEN